MTLIERIRITPDFLLYILPFLPAEEWFKFRTLNKELKDNFQNIFSSEEGQRAFYESSRLPKRLLPAINSSRPNFLKLTRADHFFIFQRSRIDFSRNYSETPKVNLGNNLSPENKLERINKIHELIQIFLNKIHKNDKDLLSNILNNFINNDARFIRLSEKELLSKFQSTKNPWKEREAYNKEKEEYAEKVKSNIARAPQEKIKILDKINTIFQGMSSRPIMLVGSLTPMIIKEDFYPWWFANPIFPSNWSPWEETDEEYASKMLARMSKVSAKEDLLKFFLLPPLKKNFAFNIKSLGSLITWEGSARIMFSEGKNILSFLGNKNAGVDLSYENIVSFLNLLHDNDILFSYIKVGFSNLDLIRPNLVYTYNINKTSYEINVSLFLKEFILLIIALEGTNNNLAILDGPMVIDLVLAGKINLNQAFFLSHTDKPLYSMAGDDKGKGVMRRHSDALRLRNVNQANSNPILSKEIELYDLFFDKFYPDLKNYSAKDQINLSMFIILNYLCFIYDIDYLKMTQIKQIMKEQEIV